MELVLLILFIVLCGLLILETRGYRSYVAAKKSLEESYRGISVTLISLIKTVHEFDAKLTEQGEHMDLLGADNDILRVMLDTHGDILGIKLPHLQSQLHKHEDD